MTTASPNFPRSIYANKLGEFPGIAFADHQAFTHRGRWNEWFRARIGEQFDGRIVYEIGCADAEFLTRIAAKHPTTAFIGIDWKCKAIYDAAAHVSTPELKNVALIRGRAQDISKAFAANEIDEIWIFHPEPCDREVERKNRLVSELFLRDAHSVLRGACSAICLKTDHADYFAHISGLPKAGFDMAVESTDYWRDDVARKHTSSRCFADEVTAYEVRFRTKRKPIFYMELRTR